jgi:DtxR family Mn-dependent transcriptional regulator
MSHVHEHDLADEDVEELAEELWTLVDEGRPSVAALQETSKVTPIEPALGAGERRGLWRRSGDALELTDAGRRLAERQIRRHRLAEVLFTTVLDAQDEAAVDRTACVIEHVLSASLTDSVCAFLGHPPRCPHGKPIPPGACCRALSTTVEPLVQPLDRLPLGAHGRIVYIAPRAPERLVRLSGLGLVPGVSVQLQQKSPAAVLRVGGTTLALDAAIAGEIYVKKLAPDE